MEKQIKDLIEMLKKYESYNNIEQNVKNINKEKENIQQNKNLKYKYSPKQVDYVEYGKMAYRREVDSYGNIKWETYFGNRSYEIESSPEISLMEKRYSELMEKNKNL
jgi:hypothetical protein